jgi:hypothetical protein
MTTYVVDGVLLAWGITATCISTVYTFHALLDPSVEER